MVDIQSATAEIRRGKMKEEEERKKKKEEERRKKKKKRKKRKKKQDESIMSVSATQGGHKNTTNKYT